jgi:hypothetical protein
MIYRRFYSEVGKLMYAVAAVDGKVQKKEYDKLREIVEKKLVPVEHSTDQFGTDNAYYAEIEFDILMDRDASSSTCFESFCNYVEAHKTAFDAHLKMMVVNLVKELAHVYRGTTSKEAALIKKLKRRLDEIFTEPKP